ncbi:MAG: ligase-associated DNA damage response endonuclease PdeM [Polaromonas sp.]|nr:ligase-associated DNA damage response endonuclease PdeM [Polaromonas sp.]
MSAPTPIVCQVHWAGQALHLLPERALWWPGGQTLFVADLHIGKAAAYRALGQPVPAGTTQRNLLRLSALLDRHAPAQLVFLGDFLHAAAARTPQVLAALADWRARHAATAMTLVRGNHDSRAGDPPAALRIEVVEEPHLLGPFACCHHPQRHPTHAVLAGHVHPVCRLSGPGRDSLRLPCFVCGDGQMVLPAFGEFTGGWLVAPADGLALYPVGGAQVWRLPGSRSGPKI